MSEIPRRSVLLAAGVALLGNDVVRADEPRKKGARERFVVGPVALKDFLSPIKRRVRDATDLPLDKVQQVIESIEIFAIDDRIWDGSDWQFAEVNDGHRPRLSIVGDLAETITDAKKRKVAVAIKTLKPIGIDTFLGSPAWRSFLVKLEFNVWQGDAEGLSGLLVTDLNDVHLAYTVHGERVTRTKDRKWKPHESNKIK